MHATPWSLDEFPAFDEFADFANPSAPEAATPALPAVSLEHLEADFAVRLAAERARIEADAYARGRADGERAARATLEEHIAHTTSALNEAVLSVQMHEARWLSNAEENIAALSVLVARHVLQREILADRTFVSDLVSKAVEQYPVDEEITVRLHPDDLAACRPALEKSLGAGVRTLRWLGDTNIQRGGCLTEGRERIIDGRVDTSLERAYRMLAGIQA
ncbi:FliH/SctL family protein [Gemmatimonas sp.]|uniref:FliH/SctL family protein n=1 Tax=Gemmatimonas sp. TaxID=1962908 RepID=UPI002ED8CD0F